MARVRQSPDVQTLEVQILERTHEIERRREIAEGLRGILAVLNSTRSLEEILDYIVGEARRLLGADAAAIYRLLPDKVLSIQSAQGLSREYVALADIPLGSLATGRAVLTRQPVALSDVPHLMEAENGSVDDATLNLMRELASQFQSVLSVPLITKEEPVGALTLYYTAPRHFSQEEIELAVAFCDQSALAIENTRLRERAREEAISAERSRIARDLHDSVTQMLFSASLIAEVLPVIWDRDQVEGRQALGELRQLTRGALAEMRAMLLELRPTGLQNARLEDLLRQLTEAIAGRMRVPVNLTVAGSLNLPADPRLALYRIAQEALNNIARHSGATQVEVSLRSLENPPGGAPGVRLEIRDNGYGFNLEQVPSDHLGLGIMRERAASVGAEITITSHPGLGTQVTVTWLEADPHQKEQR